MIKLSRKVEYGLISLLHMDSVRYPGLATAKEISEIYDIPAPLLGKVLQTLVRAGLTESEQGAKGGYRLKKPVEDMSLGEIVEGLDGPILIAACCDDAKPCRQQPACNIRTPVQRIQEELMGFLYHLPLSQFRSAPRFPDVLKEFRLQEIRP
jgi:Rrf2 family protein